MNRQTGTSTTATIIRMGHHIARGALCLLFGSCSLFTNEKITDYLNQQENTIEIVKLEDPTSFQLDSDSVVSIPSDSDCTLTYVVKNPQGLQLSATVTNTSDANTLVSALSVPYTYEVTSDNNYVKVTLTKEMLRFMDMGGVVSPVVQLSAQNYEYTIEPYTEEIRANSAPPPVEGACVMVDTSYAREKTSAHEASKGRYVLCFNLPDVLFDSTGIQYDTTKIYVAGVDSTYTKGINLGLNTTDNTWNTNDLPSSYSTKLEGNAYNSPTTVTFTAGKHPVYLCTPTYATSGDERSYTITLEDAKGLQSEVSVNVQSTQLKPVTANFIDDATILSSGRYAIPLESDSNGTVASYYTVVLAAPTKTNKPVETVSDVDVYYRVYTVQNNSIYTLLTTGKVLNEYTCNLTKGSYRIESFAHKEGYIDSIISCWDLEIGNVLDYGITIEAPDSVYFKLTLSPLILSTYTIVTNHTLTLTIVGYNSDTNEALVNPTFTEVKLTLYDKGTAYVPPTAPADPYTLDVPLYIQKDSYDVFAEFVYKGVVYSGKFVISVID